MEDINKYYIDKEIEVYWTVFEDNYLLKLHHIIEITRTFDKLINIYPNVILKGIGDFYTYEDYLYKNYKYKNDPYIKKPTYEKDMLGNYYDFMVGGKYCEKNKIITINHSSFAITSDNPERLCETLVHEFYHALDDRYEIYKNPIFKEFYLEYFKLEEVNDIQLKEFGARKFTKSYLNKSDYKDYKIMEVIDKIIKNLR